MNADLKVLSQPDSAKLAEICKKLGIEMKTERVWVRYLDDPGCMIRLRKERLDLLYEEELYGMDVIIKEKIPAPDLDELLEIFPVAIIQNMEGNKMKLDKNGKIKTSENEVKKAVNDYLQLLENQGKLYFVRNNSFAGTLISKTGYKSYVRNGKAGSPDFIVLFGFGQWYGQWLGIECKATGEGLSDIQKIAKQQIEELGGIYLEIHSIDELIKFMENK